jgi:molecular chaperone GrpE
MDDDQDPNQKEDRGAGAPPPGEGAPSAPAHEDQGAEAAPADALAAAQDEAADLRDRLLRALAEVENVRRRGAKEREDTAKYAVSTFARDMVKIAEDLHRALASAAEAGAADALVEGVRLTERELLAALERHGIVRIDPQPGEKFDHERHEAMFEVPTTEQEAGTVAHVLEAGYIIHDRLLRPARVGVAKPPSDSPPPHVDTTA